MAKRRYKVVGSQSVFGNAPGTTFEYVLTSDQEDYYYTAGHLASADKAEESKPSLHCPACEAHGTVKEKKATYADLLELREHYGKDHPALAAPTSSEEG